ncbi:MAG: bacillithiol biosynthesis deacetylase BshB1 [Candidatus Zixiibacteriota bacterium]
MSDIKLDALAIAAHRDDIEITSGGLMLKLHDLGYKTGGLDFTRGEMGTQGNEGDREREAEAASKVLGLTLRENLGLPDAQIEFNRGNVLKTVRVLREYRPHLVILPYWEQRHPDHYHCYRIAREACYFAGLEKLDCEGEPFRPHKILYSTYYREPEPSFVVDISDQFERKLEAVKCYMSQFDPSCESKQIFVPGIDIYDFIRTRDREYGMQIRKQYAEPYVIKETIEIDDPVRMLVASI